MTCERVKNTACNMFLTLPGGAKMPALGYGTWQSRDNSLEQAIECALETGYRHIDTAQSYGNEEIIGEVLKRWFDSGRLKREDVFVTTKLAATSMYPDKVEECLKESLRKLKLDYVDLYILHFPVTIVVAGPDSHGDLNVNYLDVWKKMEEQYKAGRAKHIGISNFNVKQVKNLLENCKVKPANNQVEMHIYMQQPELLDLCTKNGITMVAYSPLVSPGYNSFLGRLGLPSKTLRDTFTDKVIVRIAKKHSKTPAQVLLRFLLQYGVAPIPKSVTPSRIKENFDVFDFSLDEEDMKALRALDVGSDGRVCDWNVFEKLHEHPEYPF